MGQGFIYPFSDCIPGWNPALYIPDIKGKTFAFWGAAFKPNTDDIREAPAIYMARKIIDNGGIVQFFDPVAADNYEAYMSDYKHALTRCDNKYDWVASVT